MDGFTLKTPPKLSVKKAKANPTNHIIPSDNFMKKEPDYQTII